MSASTVVATDTNNERIKLRKSKGVWICSVDHSGVEFVSMADKIQSAWDAIQDSIEYAESGLGRMLTQTDNR
jgi:hypothetical protein